MDKLHIAVDGGGTKTFGILFRENGELIRGLRKPFGANARLLKTPDAEREVSRKIIGLLEELCGDDTLSCIGSVTFTIPGFFAEDEEFLQKLNGIKITSSSDNIAGYLACFCKNKGIAVSAGTGAFALYPTGDGIEDYGSVGGWGTYDDDIGGGYYVGICALRRLFRDIDRRSCSRLSRMLMEHFDICDDTNANIRLIELLYLRDVITRREIAALSVVTKEAADLGCEAALEIFDKTAYALADMAYSAYVKEGYTEKCKVAFNGGLKRAGDCLVKPFQRYLHTFSDKLVYAEPMFENHIGSVLFALEHLGADISADGAIVANIKKTLKNLQ